MATKVFYFDIAKKITEAILDAVFPAKCICGKWGSLICDSCAINMAKLKRQTCIVCGRRNKYGGTCEKCLSQTNLNGLLVLGPHEGILKELIWKYKYGFVRRLSASFARILARDFGSFILAKNFDIIPSPTSNSRLAWRGFGQAELLADCLAQDLGMKKVDALQKADKVIPQVGLSKRERESNLRGKISYVGGKHRRKKALVVDDVYTTGATLGECARVLKENGYKEVWGLVLSRD